MAIDLQKALRLDIPRKRFTEKTGYPKFRDSGKVGVWNLFRDGVTSSFLDLWMTCEEQARLAYVEGWTGRLTPMGIAFGSCVHDCLYRGYSRIIKTPSLLATFQTNCAGLVKECEVAWKAESPDAPTEQVQIQELVYGYAECVLPAYFRRWDGDFTGKYSFMENPSIHPKSFVSLEEQFSVPYVYPDGVIVPLCGQRDMVFTTKTDKEMIQDTKCLSIINDKEIMDLFPTDLQQNIYMLARAIETGKMPEGSVKNILRRPGHRRSKKGGIEEPLPQFFARIKQSVDDVNQWDMKGEETTGWFVRFNMLVTPDEVLHWKATRLDPIMDDLRMWATGKRPHYPRDRHAVTKYGRCGMYGPLIKNDFTHVYQRSSPFPELEVV
jgi:hypothetical protein